MMKLLLISLFTFSVWSETLLPEIKTTFKDGLKIEHPASNFAMKFRFRMQNRLNVETQEATKTDLSKAEFVNRRLRARMDGHVWDERLLYKIQLSFTRDDQDWDNANVPNILRDAVMGFRYHPMHTVWLGTTKLPGNRQRVISSGAQQFVDRSIVNANFNIDRDQALFHFSQFGTDKPLWVKLAVSNGEGRNQRNPNGSLATTARVEWLPLGSFKDEGDYFEADLSRETEPKVSFGVVQHYNQLTNKTAGTLGKALPTGELRSIQTQLADFLFKYRGFSLSSEYARRISSNPIVSNTLFITTGEGFNLQAGYVNENNWEPSLRYSHLIADNNSTTKVNDQRQYTAGISKYIKGHTIKWQNDLTYNENINPTVNTYTSNWALRMQIEIGI